MRKPPKPNKTAILLLSLLAAFLVLLTLYLAVLAPLFEAEAPPSTSPPPQTEAGEGTGITGSTLLLFPRVVRTDIHSISVSNGYDKKTDRYESYTFLRDHKDEDGDGDTYDYVIKEFPAHPYDEERFASLVVGAGYASCTKKLSEWDFSDKTEAEINEIYAGYGLSAADHPSFYTLEKTDGTVYTVYIGAKAPDGNYYARLDGRAAVYVLPASSLEESVLRPLAYFAEPRLTFEQDTQYGYIYIENFSIYHDRTFLDAFFGTGNGKAEPDLSGANPFVMFTYLRKPERDLYHSGSIYGMLAPTTAYTPSDNHVDAALQMLPGMEGSEVLKLGLSDADFAAGGLLENVAYTIYYEMPYGITYDVNEDPIVDYWIKNVLFVTRRQADGSYIVGSLSYREGEEIEVFYNMIARVEKDTLSFLEYDLVDWVEPRMFSVSIDDVAALEISSARGDYWYEIAGDGTSGQTVTEKHSGKKYFYVGRDVPFRLNKDGYCEDIEQFRNLYGFMLLLQYQGTIADDAPHLSEEEKTAIMADDSRCILSFVLTMEDGREITYRFFPYSERHSMVSVSGDGMAEVAVFYTLTAPIRQIADATWNLANGVYVDPDFRYQH